MILPSNQVIARAVFTLRGVPGTLEIFATCYIAPNIGEEPKTFYYLSVGPQALCHMTNPVLIVALRS